MTITSTPAIVQYAGDNVSVLFTVPFYFQNNTDLVLTKRSAAGIDATLVIGTDYSVTGAGNTNGGSITLIVAAKVGETLTIVSDPIIQQQTHYLLNGLFPSSDTENALDLLTRIAQVIRRREDRSIRAPDADVNPVMLLPSATVRGAGQGTFPHFAAGGGDLELVTAISGVSTPLSSSIIAITLDSLKQTAAEIAASVTPTNYAYAPLQLYRYGTNATPGTTDMTTAWNNAALVAAAGGGGQVILPAARIKTTAAIVRPLKVSFIGQGREATIIEAAHNGSIITNINGSQSDDNFAVVDGMSFTNSGGSAPARGIDYQKTAFSRVNNVRFSSGIVIGMYLNFVEYCRFSNHNNSAATGISMVSTSVADGCNLNLFEHMAFSANATVQLLINGPGSYQNYFVNCEFYNAVATTIDHTYAAQTFFVNASFEGNIAGSVKLRGGDGIVFTEASMIDNVTLIDSASFGARFVLFERPLLWNTDTITPNILNNAEITVREPTYTLAESAPSAAEATEEIHFNQTRLSYSRQVAHLPGYLNATASHAATHMTPMGGVIPTGAYNRIGSWDFSNAGQWPVVGTAGATDPLGGTTAYNMNTIVNTTHAGFGLGAAATGRTFTFQVWARFVGRVRLGIGTTNLGNVRFANFYSSYLDWHLLSITYTSGVDAGTSPFMSITTDQNTVMWRPCHYESFGPLPALQPNRNLASIVGPITVEDTRITVFGNATPGAGAFAIGDTTQQTVPVVGNPKRWRCTVAGSPGTWVSEGNL